MDDVVRAMMEYKYALDLADPYVGDILRELPALAGVNNYISLRLPYYERLENINSNYLEQKYARLEGVISRDLAKLTKRYWRSLSSAPSAASSLYDSLLGMYATQLFRTPSRRRNVLSSITEMVLQKASGPVVLTEVQKDTLLNLVTYIESLRLFAKLRQANPTIRISDSQSQAAFLTSDAPAQQSGWAVDDQKHFTEFDGKMPLSPSHFMQISKDRHSRPRIE